MPVFGIVDRATNSVVAMPVAATTKAAANGILAKFVDKWATTYTDSSTIYEHWVGHESVNHSCGEYVHGDCHTNSIESFWALLKRGHYGTHHWMSPKHLHRYVTEYAGRHNLRPHPVIERMSTVVTGWPGKRLTYRELTAL